MCLQDSPNHRHHSQFLRLFWCTALLVLLTTPILAKPTSSTKTEKQPDDNAPTLITADQMSFDQDTNIGVATGHVEIVHGDYVLHADKVIYDQNTDIVHAEGHVAILEPTGDVIFGDKTEITSDMDQGFIDKLGMLFIDNSRLTAQSGQRYAGRYLLANNGVYTACNVCAEHPEIQPLWQVQADTITHDNVEHEVYYHDATVDFAGVPVLYTPYLSTPDPTVERRQGLLTPTLGYNSQGAGYFVRQPYYFDIAPNIDATFEPTFSSNDLLQLGGEYRERFAQGSFDATGTVTYADLVSVDGVNEGNHLRGNLDANFLYNLDDVWRAGSTIDFASDQSYLERYRLPNSDMLTSRAYIEGFSGRDYAATNLYFFQDLMPSPQPGQPFVLPDATFNLVGEPGQAFGGRWSLDGGMLITQRNPSTDLGADTPDTRRLNLDAGWERQFISDTGFVTTISGITLADGYVADNVPSTSGEGTSNITNLRPFAAGMTVVKYPLGRQGDGYQEILEPIAAFNAAPHPRQDNLPNEDSLDVEYDATNLFTLNRFTGEDRQDGGERTTYGLRHTLITDNGARLEMFGGQSYQFSKNTDFPGLSGLRNVWSDYVGDVDFIPSHWFDMNYGFRLDHRDFSPRMQQLTTSAGAPIFRPFITYVLADQTETTGYIDKVEEATVGVNSTFYQYWSLGLAHVQAFNPQPGPRSDAVTLNYLDECFVFGIEVSHDDTTRLDIGTGTSVLFHFYLKNVGGAHTDNITTTAYPTQFRQQ